MATKIVTKNSSTAGSAPSASDLVQGELAVNVADKRLYTEDNAGNIVELGTNPSTIDINGGTIDGTVIGGATPAAISGTTGQFGTSLNVDGTATMDGLIVSSSTSANATFLNGVGTGMQITLADQGWSAGINQNAGSLYLQSGGLTNRLKLASNGDISFYEDTGTTAKLFWDASAESLGIGTSSPSSYYAGADNLVIHQASGEGGMTISTASNTSGALYFADGTSGDAEYRGGIAYNHSTDVLSLISGGANRAYIDSSGNVGIGVTNPNTLLTLKAEGSNVPQYSGYTTGGTHIYSMGRDGNNGLGLSAYGTLTFRTGATTGFTSGSEAMRIDSSGNVGIGTSSPSSYGHSLVVAKDAAGGGTYATITNTNTNQFLNLGINADVAEITWDNADSLAFGTTDASTDEGQTFEAMRIDPSGNVRIGTTTYYGAEKFTVAGTVSVSDGTYPYLNLRLDSGSHVESLGAYQDLIVGTTGASASTRFKTAGSERMRIDSSGNLLVGTTSGGAKVVAEAAPTGTAYLAKWSATGGTALYIEVGGSAVGYITCNASGTTYATSSDQRLKDNIADADDAGSKIDSIQVRQYDWKVDGSHQDYGMIAQELLEVAPEAVSVPEDSEEMMGVDYSKLVPMLIKEIQSLRQRVASLEE